MYMVDAIYITFFVFFFFFLFDTWLGTAPPDQVDGQKIPHKEKHTSRFPKTISNIEAIWFACGKISPETTTSSASTSCQ